MNVYIMRHGETYFNKEGKIQGSSDIELTELGVELAEISRDGFCKDGIVFDRIITSPLVRATKTAEVIAEKCLKPEAKEKGYIIDARIREMCFGHYEGLELQKLRDTDENIVNCFSDPDKYIPDETGESYDEVFARIDEFMELVLKPLEQEKDVENVLVLCHGTVIRAFLARIRQVSMLDFWKIRQPNCCINLIELADGRFTSVRENIVYYESEELLNRKIL